jgi:hypothetical protein
MSISIINQLTLCSWALETLLFAQLVRKFSAFYGQSSKQTTNGTHPAAAESSPHPHNHLRLGRTSEPFPSGSVYAIYTSHSLRFVISVTSVAWGQGEADWMLLFVTDWPYPMREEARLPFRSIVSALESRPCVASCSLLPPYGGFNHVVLVQIFYICFYSYNFNSTLRINQSTQNMF